MSRALALGVAWLGVGCGPPPETPPNLLLITVDTLRPDRLSCYGGDPGVGTSICALADGGTRFVWAFSTAPSTAPAIASILTSRYPSYHGVTQFAATFLPSDALTVAEVLGAAGYTTAAFIANPVLNRSRNLHQGFAIYDDRMNRRERNRPQLRERDAADATKGAIAWARVVDPPWFLWIHYQDPHGPYEPPDASPVSDRPDAHALSVLSDHSGLGGIPAYQALDGVFSLGAYEQRFAQEIRYVDEHVGLLVEGVESLGHPTAMLLTADHGEAFGEDDYYFAHGHSVGLDQIRVPLLWRPATPGPSREVLTPVSILDVAPTLVRVAGLEVPEWFQGSPLPEPGSGATLGSGVRPLFAEHRLRAAVLAGPAYYARDRRPLDEPVRDRITGGTLHPYPPRTARLEPAGTEPAYGDSVDESIRTSLEPLLATFLAAARDRVEPQTRDLPRHTREQLEALGYLE